MIPITYPKKSPELQIGKLHSRPEMSSVVSGQALQRMQFGLGVSVSDDTANKPHSYRPPKASQSKVVFSADFVASNVINAKVNGIAISPVTYATSHAATMTQLIANFNLLTGTLASLDTTDTNSRTILVDSTNDLAVTVSDVVVTLGASQATATITAQSHDTFDGLLIDNGLAKIDDDTTPIAKLVFSADLVSLNKVNGSVNGMPIETVTYATSHLATMNVIIAKINALQTVTAVLDSTDTNNRTIVISSLDYNYVAVSQWAVTLGASQATIAGSSIDSQVYYESRSQIPVAKQGVYVVYAEDATTTKKAVYCRFKANGSNTTLGAFRTDSDSGSCFLVSGNVSWLTTSAAGRGILVINKP